MALILHHDNASIWMEDQSVKKMVNYTNLCLLHIIGTRVTCVVLKSTTYCNLDSGFPINWLHSKLSRRPQKQVIRYQFLRGNYVKIHITFNSVILEEYPFYLLIQGA